MAWRDIKDKFEIEDIGASLLANLAKGIYTPQAVLREYVQNAGDAYLDLEEFQKKKLPISAKTIDIYLGEKNTLIFQDDGIGMDEADMRRYKRIAVSNKFGKERAGFRGIGIWAGFDACDELIVESTKVSVPRKVRLTMRFDEMRKHVHDNIDIKELLDKRFKIEVDDAKADEHYTQVQLKGLHNEFSELLQLDTLARVAAEILPCRFSPKFKYADEISEKLAQIDGYQEFVIRVEDKEVYKIFPSTMTSPKFERLSIDGEEYGFAWFGNSPTGYTFKANESRNLRLRVRNIGVGGPGMYSQEDGSVWGISEKYKVPGPEFLDWYVGELHITNPDVVPNTPRTELELDATARRAIQRIRHFYIERIMFRRAVQEVGSHRNEVETYMEKASANSIDPIEAGKVLRSMQKYESLFKSRKPPVTKIEEKETIKQAFKRQLLKDDERTNPGLAQQRKDLIDRLTEIAGGKKGSKTKRTNANNGRAPKPDAAAASATPAVGSIDAEQLFQDIQLVIEKHLGDQDELVASIAEDVAEVFRERGLLIPV